MSMFVISTSGKVFRQQHLITYGPPHSQTTSKWEKYGHTQSVSNLVSLLSLLAQIGARNYISGTNTVCVRVRVCVAKRAEELVELSVFKKG